jgi:nitrate reductase NapAB chaperone NapD
MTESLQKQFAYKAISEMRDKLKAYAKKPHANSFYLEKNKSYLESIENYIKSLEVKVHDAQFNAEFIIVTEEGNSGARLKDANKRIQQLEAIIEMKGIKPSELPFLLQDSKEILRANSISRAMADFPNLY